MAEEKKKTSELSTARPNKKERGGGREQRAKAERETCIANNGAKAFLMLQRVENAVELEKKKSNLGSSSNAITLESTAVTVF